MNLICEACGFANPPNHRYCGQCGAALTASPEQRRPLPVDDGADTAPSDLRRALGGERKQLTVMFAEIVDRDAQTGSLDPERAARRAERAIDLMKTAAHRYDGTVNRVHGEGMMALFGAPVAHEDHAARACFAALDMHEAIAAADGAPALRIGLNSGPVMVRTLDTGLSASYDAMGPAVHLAARMGQLARPGTICATQSTVLLAQGFIDARSIGPVKVKGLSGTVDAFEVTGGARMRTPWQARARYGLTSFVNRQAELDALDSALDSALSRRGRVVTLIGEPGIGKSRLVHEFTRSAAARHWTVHVCGGTPHSKTSAHLPIGALLRSWFGLDDGDSGDDAALKVRAKINALDRRLRPQLPAIYAVLGLPTTDSTFLSLGPEQRRDRIVTAVSDIFLREAELHPLILVFEDLHWMDSLTRLVIDRLAARLSTARILLLATSRPEFDDTWAGVAHYRRLQLDPLDDDAAAALLDGLIGRDTDLDPLKTFLGLRGEGLPLYLEEAILALVETGALAGRHGDYRLVSEFKTTDVPARLHAILAARIDRLSFEHKQLLQTASVIGNTVPLELLTPMSGLPDGRLKQVLADLQAGDFIHADAAATERAYAFKHALIRDVAYDSVLLDKRRDLHAELVDVIELAHADALDAQVELLAFHAERGEKWRKAVTYLDRAASKAFERTALGESVQLAQQAIEILDRLPDDSWKVAQAIDLRLKARTALSPTGRLDLANHYLAEAETLAEAAADARRLALINISKTQVLNYAGNVEDAIAAGHRACAAAGRVGDENIRVVAEFFLSQAHFFHGDYRRTIEILTPNADLLLRSKFAPRLGTTGTGAVLCLMTLARAHAFIGEFAEAFAHARSAWRAAEEVDRPFDQGLACHGWGVAALTAGQLSEAAEVLNRGLEICQTHGFRSQHPLLAGPLGYAFALQGKHASALPLLESAVAESRQANLIFFEAWSTGLLAAAHRLAGDDARALTRGRRALALADERRYEWLKVWLYRMFGQLTTAGAQTPAEALTHLTTARELASRLEMLPDLAHCQLALAEHFATMGQHADAQRELAMARRLYDRLGMTYWSPQLSRIADAE